MSSPADQNVILNGRDLHKILQLWEEKHSTAGYDPEPIVTRIAEILEEETAIYMRKDPDPFDERHPSRHYPECELGKMLKLLFRKDTFMTRLVNDYLRDNYFTNMQNIQQSSQKLNIAACRLILVIMPGLETSAVFQVEFDQLITRLYSWAENAEEPLRSYSVGLLGAAMDVQEITVGFREHNIRLLPLMLQRLRMLQTTFKSAREMTNTYEGPSMMATPTKAFTELSLDGTEDDNAKSNPAPKENTGTYNTERPFAHLGGGSAPSSPDACSKRNASPKMNGLSQKFQNTTDLNALFRNEASQGTQDRTSGYVRNMIPIYPPTIETSQMLILRYLTPMGEYQEFLPCIFEQQAMGLIFRYIDNIDSKDTCLAFEALKYLASLLCHKKFTLEFLSHGGLEKLLRVPRPSLAATGVSVAFYYLAYCEEAMERICTMSPKLIEQLVTYELSLLGCSHDSGRCHATMFFGLSFQFKIMLDEFDRQDGLRKLVNVISVLPILSNTEEYSLNDDEQCAARQVMRHVCVTLKKYFESHLFYKYNQVTRQQNPHPLTTPANVTKAPKNSIDVINEQIRSLQETIPMRSQWPPMDELIRLGGITLLLRIIALSYDWTGSRTCIAETARSALDVLNIGCVVAKVQQIFCDRIDFPDSASLAGVSILLGAAEGEIASDPDVQKSALSVLVNSICAPVNRPSGSVARYGSAKKKTSNKYSEELIQKVWESVRSNNGIIVLLQLMQTKTPITDADCIRGMACRALAGLARSDTVRQIIGKLPLFTSGQLQALMRDPILQEKRAEHVQFQKYALELMERVSGRAKSVNNETDVSLINIHKANVVAQTKIQFNEQQLNQLIYQHLTARGMQDTAASLIKEAQLKNVPFVPKPQLPLSPFTFRSPATAIMPARTRIRGKNLEHSYPGNSSCSSSTLEVNQTCNSMVTSENEDGSVSAASTPIKLIKKTPSANTTNSSLVHANQTNHQRSLQKQITSETFLSTTTQRNVPEQPPNITLDTIITEFLTNQHSLCKNPMSTCPQFDLFTPHKCPDPRPNKVSGMSTNFAARFVYRQSGFNSYKLDRRLVHSNFTSSKVIRCDTDAQFTCVDFTPCTSQMVVGMQSGEVKCFTIHDGSEEWSYNCHESNIISVKMSRDGQFLLTSSTWRSPLSALWSVENKLITPKQQWEDEEFCEFSNLVQDRVLGTKSEVATIYDINTGQKITQFVPQIYNQYLKNRATFDPSDELILSDGVLWDVRSGREIHKFDKLNQNLSGVFHPNGLEVISNTEVWDLRTFHLLRTVNTLEQCQLKFSAQNVMYAISSEVENNMDMDSYSYESSFKVLDSLDYSSIATVDVKRNIYDLCINRFGTKIAVVENQGGYATVEESAVKIYSVGRKKNNDDEMEEEDDEPSGSEQSDSDNDDDNDDAEMRPARRRNRTEGTNNSDGEQNANDSDSDDSSDNSGGSESSWETDSDIEAILEFDDFN
uniref:CSON005995 protein n=1 Tax=Culicoides sonorensis TaxID=179676 RepID=A0A336LYJ1_CULSO